MTEKKRKEMRSQMRKGLTRNTQDTSEKGRAAARSTESSSVVYRLVGEENNDLEERTPTRDICSEERW